MFLKVQILQPYDFNWIFFGSLLLPVNIISQARHTNFTVEIEKIISTIKESCSLFWFYLRGRSKNINKWTWMDPSYQFSFLMKMQGFTLSGGCIPLEHWILSCLKKSAQSHFRNWFVILLWDCLQLFWLS